MRFLPLVLPLAALFHSPDVCAQRDKVEPGLPVQGRLTDGESKLAGGEIVVFRGNEQVATMTTDKSGKFQCMLGLNDQFSIEFRKTGYVPKRVLFDTHFPHPVDDILFEPLMMDISLLAEERYQGVDTDVLDFPFALIRYDRKVQAFAQDPEYTMGMQRTNGALLLMAGRVEKRSR